MAKFYFLCPQCGHQVKAEDEWIGLEAQCPHCGKNITITKPEQPPVPVAVTKVDQDEKPCPFCGRMIKKEAIFCKHCKKSLVEPKKIKVTCQYCAEEVEIPENQQGNTVCPSCGQPLSIKVSAEEKKPQKKDVRPPEPAPDAIQNKITIRTDISAESETKIRQSIVDEFSSAFKKCDDSGSEIIVSDGLIGMKRGLRDFVTRIKLAQRKDCSGYDVVAETSSVLNKKEYHSALLSFVFSFIVTIVMFFLSFIVGIMMIGLMLSLLVPAGIAARKQPEKIQAAVNECLRRVKEQN